MKRSGLVLTVAVLALPAAAGAAPLPVSGTLDLADAPETQTVRHTAQQVDGLAGGAVAGVGDFDGDGKRDVAVGEPKRDTPERNDGGAVHVVLDAARGGRLEDATRVVTIRGAQAGDYAGFDVSAAGDVNGDGLGDVLVGAPLAGPRPEGSTVGGGEAYLVFGRPGRAAIDLAAADFGGVRITGADHYSWLGRAVESLPDVNGDGRPELIVGAPLRNVGDRNQAGSAYVVFGPAAPAAIDVSRLVEDGAGYRIDGAEATGFAGRAVSPIGDLDGDLRPEVLVSAPRAAGADSNQRNGVAYVVDGQATPGVIDLAQLGARGWTVKRDVPGRSQEERTTGDWLGESISDLGDVNGDRLPDFVVGAHLADGPDRVRGGIAYVVFGRADARGVNLARLGEGGFRIVGVGRDDQTGFATASAGDFNADGVNDLAVGAPYADPLSRESAGAVYVVYGRGGDPGEVDLAEIGERGIRIAGRDADATGFTLDGAGDVDGDGGDDLVIGSPATDAEYLFNLTSARAGSAAVVFGAAGKPGEIPGAELKADPGYKEAVAAGCRPALNVQAILDDDPYNDEQADPQRIRLKGMQAYVATPRNFGTVLGVSAFDGDGSPVPALEPQEVSAERVDFLKRDLKESISGTDAFPGYDRMFGTLADDNPSAGGRIMVIDGYTFRSVRRLKGLTKGSAPTYIVAVGAPPDRNRTDINQMRRITRETKGRYYEARTARELERALQAIQSRLRCDVEADNYQEELQPEEAEELDEVDLDEDTYSADITLSWRNPDEDYEFDEIEILDEDGEDLTSEYDDEEIDDAYEYEDEGEELDEDDEPTARAAAVAPRLTGGRGRTFRTLHVRRLRGNRTLRVTIRSDNRRSSGRVFARITQSRSRR